MNKKITKIIIAIISISILITVIGVMINLFIIPLFNKSWSRNFGPTKIGYESQEKNPSINQNDEDKSDELLAQKINQNAIDLINTQNQEKNQNSNYFEKQRGNYNKQIEAYTI